jgi:AcrR family transcriptional regulator
MIDLRNQVAPEAPSTARPTGRRYGGVDSQERLRLRRAKLIGAALAVFGEQGFHQSTVRDVCKAAQLTSRYFYESFDSMELLFQAVYTEVSKDLRQATVTAMALCPPDPDQLVAAALRAFLEFIQEDPRRARVALIDAPNVGGASLHHITDQAQHDFAQIISGFMQQVFPRLEETGLSYQMMADGLVGSNTRMVTQWVATRCEVPLEDVLRNTLAIFQACIKHARDQEARLPSLANGAASI